MTTELTSFMIKLEYDDCSCEDREVYCYSFIDTTPGMLQPTCVKCLHNWGGEVSVVEARAMYARGEVK